MSRRKKLIWWETEPIVTDADAARTRGADTGRATPVPQPFYGPVTIAGTTRDPGPEDR